LTLTASTTIELTIVPTHAVFVLLQAILTGTLGIVRAVMDDPEAAEIRLT
jgi:hypothetical protein